MAKSVKETKNIQGISMHTVEAMVKDGEKAPKPVIYLVPATAEDFAKMVGKAGTAPEFPALTVIYERYCYAADLKARASERESSTVTLPVMATKKYGKLNLVDGTFEGVPDNPWKNIPLPLENRLKMINGAIAYAQSKDEMAPRAVLKARDELIAGKQVADRNGVLVAAK